jgi:threonine dehydrogenase-like Zn-dependent dehydrogenase
MKAVQFFGRNDLRVVDVAAPSPSDLDTNQVLVSVEWCGICGTDLHEYIAGSLFFTS